MLRKVVQNWELKVVALLIACVLWAFVTTGEKAEIAVSAPLEYVGPGRDLILIGDHRETVDVHVETMRWDTARLAQGAFAVRVNLTTLPEGESFVQLSPDQVQVPPGVTVTRIAPSRIRVNLVRAETATLRVVPHLRGTPAPGFTVRRVAVEPSAVQVKGPRFTIEGRGTVETIPVDIADRQQTVVETVGLVLPDGAYLTKDRAVQMTVEIIAEGGMRQGRKEAVR
jgi:YbbR domain-containing protein